MTDKERLEDIKERLNCTLVSFGRSNGKTLFSDDIDWLTQQAERVEELKNRCTEIAAESTVREEKLLKENQRLEKRVEELEEELNGAEHRYGYKQMYKICNRDYATLNSEKNRYKQALKNIEELWANREFNDNLAWGMLLESRQALKGRRG